MNKNPMVTLGGAYVTVCRKSTLFSAKDIFQSMKISINDQLCVVIYYLKLVLLPLLRAAIVISSKSRKGKITKLKKMRV